MAAKKLSVTFTPEINAKLKAHANKWIAHAFDCEPCDRAKVTRGIVGMYAAAGLKAPRVVFVPSPYACALVYGAAAWWWRVNKHKTRLATEQATRLATDQATYLATEQATYLATYLATEQATDQATDQATYLATRLATEQATRQATDQATYLATEQATVQATYLATRQATDQATEQATRLATEQATYLATEQATVQATYLATRQATDQATRLATDQATYLATELATYLATYLATEQATDQATDQATYLATYLATEQATEQATVQATYLATELATYLATELAKDGWVAGIMAFCRREALDLRGALGCARLWARPYQGGRMWSAWMSYLTAFRDMGWLKLKEYENFRHYEDAADAGFRCLHEEFCVVTDNPEFIKVDDQNRPHCDDGPSHRWRDGWSLYHVHGVRVPGWIIERSDTITAESIAAEENIEVRRIMIDRMGVARYLRDTGAKVIAMDLVPVARRGDDRYIPRALMEDRDGRRFLCGTDGSTHRVYYMQVSNDAQTCAQAHESISHLPDHKCVASS